MPNIHNVVLVEVIQSKCIEKCMNQTIKQIKKIRSLTGNQFHNLFLTVIPTHVPYYATPYSTDIKAGFEIKVM